MSKAWLIRELSLFLEIPCQLQVDVHKNLGTIIGYHIGLGDKEACQNLVVLYPYDFNVGEYLKKKVAHKARGIKEQAAQNKLVMGMSTKDAAIQGIIGWKDFAKHARAKEMWESWQEEEREDIPEDLPEYDGQVFKWDADVKQTHLWLWSMQSDKGKTTWARSLAEKYAYVWKDDFSWWNDLDSPKVQGVILDDFEGELKPAKLKRLCDGQCDLNNKYGGVTKLTRKLHIIVISNFSIASIYPKHYQNLYSRFIEYNCD